MNDKIRVVHLDLDGVVVDLLGGIGRLFGAPTDYWRNIHGWDQTSVALNAALGTSITEADVWNTVRNAGPDFWAELDWTPWGRAIVAAAERIAPVVIVSTPLGGPGEVGVCPHSAAGKVRWVNRNMPEHAKKMVLAKTKGDLGHPGALLIDDGAHNIKAHAENGARTLMIPAPWNTPHYKDDHVWDAVFTLGSFA